MAARRLCLKRGLPFTTAFHTRFPEYRRGALRGAGPGAMPGCGASTRPSHGVMVATETVRRKRSPRAASTSCGVGAAASTTRCSTRRSARRSLGLPRPIFLFCRPHRRREEPAGLPRRSICPARSSSSATGRCSTEFRRRYPARAFPRHARGRGARAGLCRLPTCSSFRACTDTFGLVLLEALASGVPVAAFPVPGPLDIIGDSGVGVLDRDLGKAALAALGDPARALPCLRPAPFLVGFRGSSSSPISRPSVEAASCR